MYTHDETNIHSLLEVSMHERKYHKAVLVMSSYHYLRCNVVNVLQLCKFKSCVWCNNVLRFDLATQ